MISGFFWLLDVEVPILLLPARFYFDFSGMDSPDHFQN
jgi:hypothetical protein